MLHAFFNARVTSLTNFVLPLQIGPTIATPFERFILSTKATQLYIWSCVRSKCKSLATLLRFFMKMDLFANNQMKTDEKK